MLQGQPHPHGFVCRRNPQAKGFGAQNHGVRLDAIHPFISQPLVEFSLRTPAFMFGDGGEDRALERRAFGDLAAVRRGRLRLVDGDYTMLPGPRLPQLYRRLAAALAP